ncbi:serine/threonine-protein kinase [Streptomyces sp. NPDC046876]|uniref:serine/threonine-protein kinase n=1 Tax=Streptomyces sp. NPDC046876 TaxID=3155616 RepID=UPI0033FD22D4
MERGALIAGRYELVKRLGRGGMGEVWAARDQVLHRDIALKLLVLEEGALPELAQRFEREAVAAAQINHPNVAALYDRGVHEDMLFLVMEKVDGIPLNDLIRSRAPLPPGDALAIAEGIARALTAAHRAGVIHYDIKPHNVMLTADHDVKVVDFGIAGFLQTAFSVAHSSQLTPAGSPQYGAPEQFLSVRGDERSDLYGLGSVLFAMLTGRPPFTGHSALAVIRRKSDVEAPRLDAVRAGLPPELTALIAELLDRDPARRPQTAQDVSERIGRLRAAEALVPPGRDAGRGTHAAARPPSSAVREGDRDVLLARAACAMRAVLRRRSPLPTVPAARSIPTAPSSGPFLISWSGREPLSTYAARPGARKTARAWVGAVLSTAAAVSCFSIPPHLGLTAPGEKGPWPVVQVFGGSVFSAMALFLWPLVVVHTRRAVRHGLARMVRSGWELEVGPSGIATVNASVGRTEFPWSVVHFVSISTVRGSLPHRRYTAVHVSQYPGSRLPVILRPAGWPYTDPDTLPVEPHQSTPICVLGPMTERQRRQLMEALAEFGGDRWVSGFTFATLPLDSLGTRSTPTPGTLVQQNR